MTTDGLMQEALDSGATIKASKDGGCVSSLASACPGQVTGHNCALLKNTRSLDTWGQNPACLHSPSHVLERLSLSRAQKHVVGQWPPSGQDKQPAVKCNKAGRVLSTGRHATVHSTKRAE